MEKENKFNFKFLNIAIYILFGVAIFYVLKNLGIWQKIVQILISLTPVYIGIIICWISSPLAKKLRKIGFKDKSAAFISLFIIFGIFIVVFSIAIPIIVKEITNLVIDFPNIYDNFISNINNLLNENNLLNGNLNFDKDKLLGLSQNQASLDFIKKYLSNILSFSVDTIHAIVNGVIVIFTTIVVSFFLVKDIDKYKEKLVNHFTKGNKNSQKYRMYQEIDVTLMSYVKGVLLDSLIVGILVTIVCYILKIKYGVIFGILTMLLNLIPYFGAIFSELIVALFALSTGGVYFAILTFGLCLLVQVIDANILQPNIIAKSVNLHPVVTIAGLLIFNILFGFFGMIIAVPAIAVIKIIIKYKYVIKYDKQDINLNKM